MEYFHFKVTKTLIIIEDLVMEENYVTSIMIARECSLLKPSAGQLGVLHVRLIMSQSSLDGFQEY
jgi:hypothetical protein